MPTRSMRRSRRPAPTPKVRRQRLRRRRKRLTAPGGGAAAAAAAAMLPAHRLTLHPRAAEAAAALRMLAGRSATAAMAAAARFATSGTGAAAGLLAAEPMARTGTRPPVLMPATLLAAVVLRRLAAGAALQVGAAGGLTPHAVAADAQRLTCTAPCVGRQQATMRHRDLAASRLQAHVRTRRATASLPLRLLRRTARQHSRLSSKLTAQRQPTAARGRMRNRRSNSSKQRCASGGHRPPWAMCAPTRAMLQARMAATAGWQRWHAAQQRRKELLAQLAQLAHSQRRSRRGRMRRRSQLRHMRHQLLHLLQLPSR